MLPLKPAEGDLKQTRQTKGAAQSSQELRRGVGSPWLWQVQERAMLRHGWGSQTGRSATVGRPFSHLPRRFGG